MTVLDTFGANVAQNLDSHRGVVASEDLILSSLNDRILGHLEHTAAAEEKSGLARRVVRGDKCSTHR